MLLKLNKQLILCTYLEAGRCGKQTRVERKEAPDPLVKIKRRPIVFGLGLVLDRPTFCKAYQIDKAANR